ncbi:MAG: hypothetical protein AB1489_32715 [Acidobacteriota bacterium]
MKIDIYLKSTKQIETYDFEPSEAQRLAEDFHKYLESGTPKRGAYNYADPHTKQQKLLYLVFDAIDLMEADL